MAADLEIARLISDLRGTLATWRRDGLTVGLVPTMGALHEGHFSLIRRSVTENDRTIVTLFVNPRQFGPAEDLAVYPRDEAKDAQAAADLGADLLYAPETGEMYPQGAVTAVSVPGLGDLLEGKFRPGFFTGVATVVAKLFIQAASDRAYFGEKDYQQLCVIRRMVKDLDLAVEIVACPTRREPDGLAISSRNVFLSPAERMTAPSLHRTLKALAAQWRDDGDRKACEQEAANSLIGSGFDRVDYLAIRRPETLVEPEPGELPVRILGAASIGTTRLIDNISVDQQGMPAS